MSSFLHVSCVSGTAPQQGFFWKAQSLANIFPFEEHYIKVHIRDIFRTRQECVILSAVLFTSCFSGQFGYSSRESCGLGKGGVNAHSGNVASSLHLLGCALFVLSFHYNLFFQLISQIWHGESGWNSKEFIRGFSCQNLTPNIWNLILNLGGDFILWDMLKPLARDCWEGPGSSSRFTSAALFEPCF